MIQHDLVFIYKKVSLLSVDEFEEMNKNIERSFVKKMEFDTQVAILLMICCVSCVNKMWHYVLGIASII